jgi:hypothetical protein
MTGGEPALRSAWQVDDQFLVGVAYRKRKRLFRF